jgi:hypothetical protein
MLTGEKEWIELICMKSLEHILIKQRTSPIIIYNGRIVLNSLQKEAKIYFH